jgi:hypothetical protein
LKKKTLLLLKQKRPASVAVPTMRFMAVFAKQTGGCDETKVLESKEKEISPRYVWLSSLGTSCTQEIIANFFVVMTNGYELNALPTINIATNSHQYKPTIPQFFSTH